LDDRILYIFGITAHLLSLYNFLQITEGNIKGDIRAGQLKNNFLRAYKNDPLRLGTW